MGGKKTFNRHLVVHSLTKKTELEQFGNVDCLSSLRKTHQSPTKIPFLIKKTGGGGWVECLKTLKKNPRKGNEWQLACHFFESIIKPNRVSSLQSQVEGFGMGFRKGFLR